MRKLLKKIEAAFAAAAFAEAGEFETAREIAAEVAPDDPASDASRGEKANRGSPRGFPRHGKVARSS